MVDRSDIEKKFYWGKTASFTICENKKKAMTESDKKFYIAYISI